MKFLLVLIVVLIGVWVWRSSRRGGADARAGRAAPDADLLIDMVVCDLCGVHCPKTDLVVGRRGVYCSVQHHNQAEP